MGPLLLVGSFKDTVAQINGYVSYFHCHFIYFVVNQQDEYCKVQFTFSCTSRDHIRPEVWYINGLLNRTPTYQKH